MKSQSFLVVVLASLAATTPTPRTTKVKAARQEPSHSNKKGLAYNDRGILDIFGTSDAVGWSYDWSPNPDPRLGGIPMCWGAKADCHSDLILQQLHRGDGGGESWVLGYNEPDLTRETGGSYLTPKQAYDSWGNDMFQFKEAGAKIVCPGISSYDAQSSKFTGFESGLAWLRSFVSLSSSPDSLRCDAQALHWYGEAGKSGSEQAKLFIDYMDNAHSTVKQLFGRDVPIWVTEFGPLPENNVQVLKDFMDGVVGYLERTPWIARYSPFKPEQMVGGGGLNDAGRSFMNPQSPQPAFGS